MTTSRNTNDAKSPSQAGPTSERPSTNAAEVDRKADAVRTASGAPSAFVAAPPAAAAEVPAREDKDPVTFQRNAVQARLSDAKRQELASKLS